jgi:hypothetical protein
MSFSEGRKAKNNTLVAIGCPECDSTQGRVSFYDWKENFKFLTAYIGNFNSRQVKFGEDVYVQEDNLI